MLSFTPSGTRHTNSPVAAFTAIRLAHGGRKHGRLPSDRPSASRASALSVPPPLMHVRKLGVLRLLVVARIRRDPAGRRLVLRVHEDVSELGIGGGAAPVHSAGHAREDRATAVRRWAGSSTACTARRCGTSRLSHNSLHACACSGVVSSAVTRSFVGHAHSGERTGLLRDRLRRRIPLARHVCLCHRTFIDAVNRACRSRDSG